MRPPLCIECHVHAVRRHRNARTPKRGLRIIDGIAWRWFCGRVCTGRHIGATYVGQAALAGSKAHQANARARLVQRLLTACHGVMDSEGRVPVKAMVKAMATELRVARAAGYSACLQRHRIIARDERRTA